MDPFQNIKKRTYFGKQPVLGDEVAWLVQEVVRLRRIEDAAIDIDKCVSEFPDDLSACQESFEQLHRVLDVNPRPED